MISSHTSLCSAAVSKESYTVEKRWYIPKPIQITGFYTKLNVWGSLGLNFEYDGGPIIEIGGPIYLCKLRILEGSTRVSTSFREGSVLSPGQ